MTFLRQLTRQRRTSELHHAINTGLAVRNGCICAARCQGISRAFGNVSKPDDSMNYFRNCQCGKLSNEISCAPLLGHRLTTEMAVTLPEYPRALRPVSSLLLHNLCGNSDGQREFVKLWNPEYFLARASARLTGNEKKWLSSYNPC